MPSLYGQRRPSAPSGGECPPFRALLPRQSEGLRFPAGAPLRRTADLSRRRGGGRVLSSIRWVAAGNRPKAHGHRRQQAPNWRAGRAGVPGFLWTGDVAFRKEVVGALPDGPRIHWYFTEGRCVCWTRRGSCRPAGATAWAFAEMAGESRSGARLRCSYGGVFDLCSDGYARAARRV
jgi:hypothetical protein